MEPWTNVVDWAKHSDIVTGSQATDLVRLNRTGAQTMASTLAAIKNHRDLLRSVLSPLAQGKKPPAKVVDKFNGALEAALTLRCIDAKKLEWRWKHITRLEDIVAPAILDAADLLTSGDHSRVGSCPACGWLFYDSSRNKCRQWCDMADCGSRDKALKYYHRKRRTEQGHSLK